MVPAVASKKERYEKEKAAEEEPVLFKKEDLAFLNYNAKYVTLAFECES